VESIKILNIHVSVISSQYTAQCSFNTVMASKLAKKNFFFEEKPSKLNKIEL